jgi:hypothetical protein
MNGLPALAQDLASRGRNGDSMLVHMTPGEVQGLQALAYTQGGSLSVNPDTGLVEANFLKRILPAIAGAALAATGIGAPMAGLMVGGFETIRTGDLGQGLLAGLGAFGGAGMGSALSSAGQASTQAAAQTAAAGPDLAAQTSAMGDIAGGKSFYGNTLGPEITPTPMINDTGAQLAPTTTTTPALTPEQITAGQLPGTAATGPSKIADMGAGFESLGAESDVGRRAFMKDIGGYSGLAQSTLATAAPFAYVEPEPLPTPEDPYANYKGPVRPSERAVRYPSADDRRRLGTGEFTYFIPSNPIPYAEGGAVSPAQAQVMQNIANIQNLAGIPAISASLPATAPAARPAPRAGLVYNPIQSRNNAIPSRETNYGFKPVEYVDKPDLSGLDMGGSLLGRLAGKNNLPEPQYAFDRATQTIRPSQAYLDAIAARRQQIADQQAAEAQAAASSMNSGGFKTGGSVPTLEEGGFVLTKKAVDGLGGGSNKRGQKVATRGLGAVPIKGPGTGTSDSIPTTIAGKQRALVSNGEAYVPAKKVKQNGGAKAFYELMARAEKAARR